MTSKIPLRETSDNNNSKRQLQPAQRIEICNLHKHGVSFSEIGRRLNVAPSTVRFTVKKYVDNSSGITPPRIRKPFKLSERAVDQILSVVKANPSDTFDELTLKFNIKISKPTLNNLLKKHGYGTRERFFLNRKNQRSEKI